MAVLSHLQELKNKHTKIDEKIKTELKSPQPNSYTVTELKKQKLRIKDQINSLKAS